MLPPGRVFISTFYYSEHVLSQNNRLVLSFLSNKRGMKSSDWKEDKTTYSLNSDTSCSLHLHIFVCHYNSVSSFTSSSSTSFMPPALFSWFSWVSGLHPHHHFLPSICLSLVLSFKFFLYLLLQCKCISRYQSFNSRFFSGFDTSCCTSTSMISLLDLSTLLSRSTPFEYQIHWTRGVNLFPNKRQVLLGQK